MKNVIIISVVLSCVSFAGHVAGQGSRWLTAWRAKSEIRTDDIAGMTEATSGFGDFHDQLNEVYNALGSFRSDGGDFARNLFDVAVFSRSMDFTFTMAALLYYVQHVVEYFSLTGRYAGELTASTGGGRGSCMLAALYDRGVILHAEFEDIVYGLLLVPDKAKACPRDAVVRQLTAYREKYKNFFASTGFAYMPPSPVPRRFARTEQRPREVRRVIVRFPAAFCARWTPLVGPFLLSENPVLDCGGLRNSVFVCHVFENEICEVHIPLGNTGWKCDRILNSQEYGLEKYEEDITKTIKRDLQRKTQKPPTRTRGVKFLFSLAELKKPFNEEYRSNKNAVRYYNIASDAMLLVSIREGGKLFKGIKHLVTRNCGPQNDVSVNEILGLRTTLSAFKTVFNRLVTVMLNKKRIDVTTNPHKISFEDQVNLLVKLLNVRDKQTDDGMSISEMCYKVPKLLEDEKYDARRGHHENADVKFHEFYLTLPILHVNELYRFYAHEFF